MKHTRTCNRSFPCTGTDTRSYTLTLRVQRHLPHALQIAHADTPTNTHSVRKCTCTNSHTYLHVYIGTHVYTQSYMMTHLHAHISAARTHISNLHRATAQIRLLVQHACMAELMFTTHNIQQCSPRLAIKCLNISNARVTRM